MEIFTFNGYDGEKIALKLKEVIGFPDSTSYEGGYDIICSLEIDVGCYKAKFDRYYSATGALYSFSNQLKECYERLKGEAKYALLLENDLIFTVTMGSSGHATVKGKFQERPDINNVLSFEMDTDQSCLLLILCYSAYPGKVKRLEAKVKQLEKKQIGVAYISKLINDLIGKRCIISSESVFSLAGKTELSCKIIDADDEWIKICYTERKDKQVVKLMRIENVDSIEEQ